MTHSDCDDCPEPIARTKVICDPSGETARASPSGMISFGVPPRTETPQTLSGWPAAPQCVTNKELLSGNQPPGSTSVSHHPGTIHSLGRFNAWVSPVEISLRNKLVR